VDTGKSEEEGEGCDIVSDGGHVERKAAQRLGGLLRMIHLVNSHPVQKLYDEGIVRFPNSRNEHVGDTHFQVLLGSKAFKSLV